VLRRRLPDKDKLVSKGTNAFSALVKLPVHKS
jgi:hypothetical protein